MDKIPSKIFTIEIQGNSYDTKITQGKMIDFELNKVTFSKGFYSSITDVQTLNLIDSMSALNAFFPQIKKDSKIDFLELEPTETKEIFDVMEGFFSWYLEWKKFMSEPKKEEKLEESKEVE